MEEKKPISHIVAGLLIALAVIIFSVVMTLAGGANPSGGWVSYLIIIFGLVFFIQRYGKAIDYKASFGDYFSYGFKATTMVVLLFVVFLVVFSLATPEMKQKTLEATRVQLEQQKNLTGSDVDKAVELTNKYFWTVIIGTAVFFFALIGAVGSLIGAAVTKKLPKNPFESTPV